MNPRRLKVKKDKEGRFVVESSDRSIASVSPEEAEQLYGLQQDELEKDRIKNLLKMANIVKTEEEAKPFLNMIKELRRRNK